MNSTASLAHRPRLLLRKLLPASVPLLFLLLSASFLWQPILTGKAFLPTDLLFRYDYLWKSYEDDPRFTVAQNPLLSDVSDYFYPYANFSIEQLSAGHFPLWNPYMFAGTPFFASAQPAVLDPINLPAYLAGPLDYWTWGAWLRLALLGYTTYGFVRALGRSEVGSLAAGVIFMACGFVAVWLNYSIVTTLAWMPALFWATTRLLQTGQAVWLAATALALGCVMLGGHPETGFLVGLSWGLYALYTLFFVWLDERRKTKDERRQIAVGGKQSAVGSSHASGFTHYVSRFTFHAPALRLSSFVGAAALGLALGAVQLFTFVDFLLNSNALEARAGPPLPADLGESVARLAVLLYPNFGGTPIERNYWFQPFSNFNEQTGYVGLLALTLAAFGAVSWWKRDRLAPFFALGVVLAALLAVRAPGFHLVKALPIFSVGHGVRWLIIFSFFGAVLAGYGLDALLALRPRTRKLRDAAFWVTSAALGSFGLALLVYIGIRDYHWDESWGPLLSHPKMARFFHPAHLTLYWPSLFLAMGAAALLAWWRGWLRKSWVAPLMLLLLYADLWTFGSKYNPVTPREHVYPQVAAVQFLEEKLGHERFVGTANTLRPNGATLFGLRDLRGYEHLVDRPFAQLYRPLETTFDLTRMRELELNRDEHRLLQVASVRYVLAISRPFVEGDPKPYPFRLADGRVGVYENIDALPRAHTVFSATLAPTIEASKAALLDPAHDPRQSVVLTVEGLPLSLSGGRAESAVPIRWLRDEPEEVELRVEMPAPGYLVLSDSYAPGWEALVDGQPQAILRANVAYRAVALGAGGHTVSFLYRPQPFYAGAAVSIIAALVILGIAVAHLLRSRFKVQGSKSE